jgi:integrase
MKTDFTLKTLKNGLDKLDHFMTIKFSWEKILEKVGIENFRFHDLRHTALSYMYAEIRNLVAVQKVAGHRDIRSTERYVHAFDKEKKWAVGSLDLVYPRIKVRQCRGE